jgi:hypothetical protein
MKYYQFVTQLSRKVFGTNGNVALLNYEEYEKKLATIENFHHYQYLTFGLLQGFEDKIFVPKYKEKGPSSKLTNLLWIEGESLDLGIDNNLKKLIDIFSHFGLLFFETSLVYKNGNPLKYWYVVPRYEGLDFINFSKATFIHKPEDYNEKTWQYYNFKNAAELQKFETKNKLILHKNNISIKEDCESDFFALQFVFNRPVGYLVSERLKEEIESKKMTGMQFLELNERWP